MIVAVARVTDPDWPLKILIAAGIFAGFITGRSGVIPKGRELMATLESDLPVELPAGASLAPVPVQARAVQPVEAVASVPADQSGSVEPETDLNED